MDANLFAADLLVLVYEDQRVKSVQTFREVGMLTNDTGLVVTMKDGSEFQLTVVQSRRERG